ncbi:MAG: TetR/AcrR family transcriptional regulator [Eggerthellaceae bacterium]
MSTSEKVQENKDARSDCEDSPQPSLRERKKEQTRQAIEKAILELTLEKGYESVTVEEVCERVGISRKTFFNYFASKRSAVLGRAYIPSAEQILEALTTHPDSNYLDVVTHCLEKGLTALDATEEIMTLRNSVMSKYPEIFFRTNKSSLTMQPSIKSALQEFLTAYPEKRKLQHLTLEEECLAGTSLIVCLMRTHIMMASFGEIQPIRETRAMMAEHLR